MSIFQRRDNACCKCKTPSPELLWRCSSCKTNYKFSSKLGQEQAKKVDERLHTVMGPCSEALRSFASILVRANGGIFGESSSLPTIDEYKEAQQKAVKALTSAFGSFFEDDIATLKKKQETERRHTERKHLVDELLSTEKEYNTDMQTVLEVWIPAVESSKCFDSKQQGTIFNMIKQIATLSNEFLKVFSRVAEMPEEEQNLGESMLKMVPFLRLYVEQTSVLGAVSDLINDAAAKNRAFQAMQRQVTANPRAKGLDLLGFLVMPMQRLARYPLLLQSILKCTDDSHRDHDSLTRVLAELRKVLAEVNELSKLRMSVSLFSSLQQTLTWSSRPVDLVLSGALIQCNEDSNWELRRFKNEHNVVMKGNHLLLTNIIVMLMENGSDQKLHEKKMFYPQELELQPEDHDAPNVVKINVHRIQKEYAEEKKPTIATRRMNRSLSVTAETPGAAFPFNALDALKKPPKYVLYINCKDFLEMQSWITHFKDLIDGCSPLPSALYPLNSKIRPNGIRRTANGSRHVGSKIQTISLEEAAGRMQVSTPTGTPSAETPTGRFVVKEVPSLSPSSLQACHQKGRASHSGALSTGSSTLDTQSSPPIGSPIGSPIARSPATIFVPVSPPSASSVTPTSSQTSLGSVDSQTTSISSSSSASSLAMMIPRTTTPPSTNSTLTKSSPVPATPANTPRAN